MRAVISQENLSFRKSSSDTFPDLPQLGMVGMVLLTEPHTAAESGSRQCSVPGAGTGVSKDGHPEGSGL